MLTASYDKSVCIWDLKSNMRDPVQILTDFQDSVTSVACSGSEIFAGSVDGNLRTYDLRIGQLATDLVGDPITWINLSEDKKSSLLTCLGGPVLWMENRSGKPLQRYLGYLLCVLSILYEDYLRCALTV